MNCVQYMCKHALHLRNSIIIDIFFNSYFAIVRMFVKRIKKKNYLLREKWNRSKNSMEKNYLSNKFIRLLIRLINSSNIFIFDQSGKISNNFERIIHLETRRESWWNRDKIVNAKWERDKVSNLKYIQVEYSPKTKSQCLNLFWSLRLFSR